MGEKQTVLGWLVLLSLLAALIFFVMTITFRSSFMHTIFFECYNNCEGE